MRPEDETPDDETPDDDVPEEPGEAGADDHAGEHEPPPPATYAGRMRAEAERRATRRRARGGG